MSKLLGNPKLLALIIIGIVVLLISVAGGALGSTFGFGFLGHPLAVISLAAEPIGPKTFITNSMIATWAAILLLAVLSFLTTRKNRRRWRRLVPGRANGRCTACRQAGR